MNRSSLMTIVLAIVVLAIVAGLVNWATHL